MLRISAGFDPTCEKFESWKKGTMCASCVRAHSLRSSLAVGTYCVPCRAMPSRVSFGVCPSIDFAVVLNMRVHECQTTIESGVNQELYCCSAHWTAGVGKPRICGAGSEESVARENGCSVLIM